MRNKKQSNKEKQTKQKDKSVSTQMCSIGKNRNAIINWNDNKLYKWKTSIYVSTTATNYILNRSINVIA